MLDDTTAPATHAIIGACLQVHGELGPGFTEVIYGDALEVEMRLRGIPFVREAPTAVHYRGRLLRPYRMDFVCYDSVVVELKALATMGKLQTAQLVHYLACTRHQVGLLVNFGARSLEVRRFVHGYEEPVPGRRTAPPSASSPPTAAAEAT